MVTPLMKDLLNLKNENNNISTKNIVEYFTLKNYKDPRKSAHKHIKKMLDHKVIKRARIGLYKVVINE